MAGTNEDDAGGKRAARDHWNLDFIAALSRPWSSIDIAALLCVVLTLIAIQL